MKSAGKARNNGLYRHIRTSKEIIRNLLNDSLKKLLKMEVILTGQSTKISTEIFQKNNFKVKYFRQLIRYRTEDGIARIVGT